MIPQARTPGAFTTTGSRTESRAFTAATASTEPPGHLQPQLQAPNPPTFTTTMTIAESPREKRTQTQIHMLSAHEGSPASERRRWHGGQREFSARGVRENVRGSVCGN